MRITRMAEALHVLPYSGGLLEQPKGALLRMEAILAASSQPNTATENREAAKQRLQKRFSKD